MATLVALVIEIPPPSLPLLEQAINDQSLLHTISLPSWKVIPPQFPLYSHPLYELQQITISWFYRMGRER